MVVTAVREGHVNDKLQLAAAGLDGDLIDLHQLAKRLRGVCWYWGQRGGGCFCERVGPRPLWGAARGYILAKAR